LAVQSIDGGSAIVAIVYRHERRQAILTRSAGRAGLGIASEGALMGTDYFGMSWVLTSPPWLICAGIAIILFATGIVGLTANTRMMKSVIDVSDRDLAKAIIGLLAGLSSLLLALTVSQVRTAFDAAENLVKIEGSQFRQMDMLLDELGADGQKARLLLRDYIRSIVQDEWPALALGGSSPVTAEKAIATTRAILKLEHLGSEHPRVLALLFPLSTGLLHNRIMRLDYADGSISPLFIVLTILMVIIMFFVASFVSDHSRLTVIFNACGALAIGAVFFLILELNFPFGGVIDISPHPIATALAPL